MGLRRCHQLTFPFAYASSYPNFLANSSSVGFSVSKSNLSNTANVSCVSRCYFFVYVLFTKKKFVFSSLEMFIFWSRLLFLSALQRIFTERTKKEMMNEFCAAERKEEEDRNWRKLMDVNSKSYQQTHLCICHPTTWLYLIRV